MFRLRSAYSSRLSTRPLAALAAVLITGGCFATRQDVQILQNDLASLRAQNQQADSIHRTQLDHVIVQLAAVNDSLSLLTARSTRSMGDVRQDLYGMSQQLIQIQQLTGQSQSRLQELRGQLERRAPAPAAPGRRPRPTGSGRHARATTAAATRIQRAVRAGTRSTTPG